MTITELQELLEDIKTLQGDIDVCISKPDDSFYTEVRDVGEVILDHDSSKTYIVKLYADIHSGGITGR